MPLDPQMAEILERTRGAPAVADLTVAEARHTEAARLAGPPPSGEGLADVVDGAVVGAGGGVVPIRVYRPPARAARPILVYFHDGGWVLGGIAVSDRVCRALAAVTGCIVISVGYRLAPEHRFPAAVEDAHAATVWALVHAAELGGAPRRVGVAGEGAGGSLAAAVTLLLRAQRRHRLRLQLLMYPSTEVGSEMPSMSENAEGYGLTRRDLRWFAGHYLNRERDALNPLASPLRAEDHSGLPPALIVTAEYDPLRDEGEAYAEKLRASGVAVKVRRYDGMIHGFLTYQEGSEVARAALAEIGREVREALRR